METENDFDIEGWMADALQLLQHPDLYDASDLSRILQQTSDAVEADIPLPNLDDGSIFSTFGDCNNNNSYINSYNDNMASVLSTSGSSELAYNEYTNVPPNWDPYSGVQSSPSTSLEKPVILTIVNPVFASSADVAGFLQTPADSSTQRLRCSSTSDIPDKTTKKNPRKRLTSEVERKEKRKESNRRAAGKYRQKQRETAKYKQEDYDRLKEENRKLRERNEFLERELASNRRSCRCHSLDSET